MGEFDAFFGAHAGPVWNYLRRLTGDRERSADLFQKIFLKGWTHFSSRTGQDDRAWIFTIAVNEARDEMRRRKRDLLRPMAPEDLRGRAAEAGAGPEATEVDGV